MVINGRRAGAAAEAEDEDEVEDKVAELRTIRAVVEAEVEILLFAILRLLHIHLGHLASLAELDGDEGLYYHPKGREVMSG